MSVMPKYKDIISLIPFGLPQYLDFEVSFQSIKKINMTFMEELDEGQVVDNSLIVKNVKLHQVEKNEDEEWFLPSSNKIVDETECCSVNSEKHLGPWLDRWIPIPFFRETDNCHEDNKPIFQYGPTNWARAYLTKTASETDSEPSNWRLVICFDMQVNEEDSTHCGLTDSDVSDSAVCSLAYMKRDNAQFLMEGWVSEWLKAEWNSYFSDEKKSKEKPRRVVDDYDEDDTGEMHLAHLASYLVYLALIDKIIGGKKVRIAKVEEGSGEGSFINVDLVLDIGNSRSTGVLVEHVSEDNPDSVLLDSYRLELRDMSLPYKIYTEPFETRIEFVKTELGLSEFSDRSGRENAFSFVSPIRTGPEANRLASKSVNSEGASGMSSPKRYLWDLDEKDLWFFNKSHENDNEELVSSLTLCRYVNNAGIPLANLKELKVAAEPIEEGQEKPKLSSISIDLQNIFGREIKNQNIRFAMQPRFSRSSLMMFLFIELIQQALMAINSPSVRDTRSYPDRPRRLRSLIFTVPPGIPVVERNIYNTWGKIAVEVVWNVLGWGRFYQDYGKKVSKKEPRRPIDDFRCCPSIKCLWDEATCSQLVYIYNEIKHNYAYDAHLFFEAMGKKRRVPVYGQPNNGQTEIRPTLRVATIDIGGGTTDVSITTFVLANDKSSTNRIWPKQEIIDGFNIGGDDVIQDMVTSIVLKSISSFIVKKSNGSIPQHRVEESMRAMFGQKSSDQRIQNLRVQFIRQVLLPAVYALLNMYEAKDLHDDTGFFSFEFRELFEGETVSSPFKRVPKPAKEVLDFFSSEIMKRFGFDMDILDMAVSISCVEIDKVIGTSMESTLDSLGELVSAYNCDTLILTGRPSCWNAVVRKIFSMMCIAPDRVMPMRNYKVGSWYRFANESGNIKDPKTTVIMGAVLCQLAENSLEGFVFNSNILKLKDTARFIGELNNQGTLIKEKVWFDLSGNSKKTEFEHIVDFSAPISIGYRQLSTDRWTTKKSWIMDFATDEDRENSVGKTPYKVKVLFKIPDPEDSNLNERSFYVDKLNQPSISDDNDAITQRDGEVTVKRSALKIKLSTISKSDEKGCWMDTGILYR